MHHTSTTSGSALNAWLDRLPRPTRDRWARVGPTFRACGVTGYYVATVVCVLGAIATGRSLWAAALLCVVAAWSFFVSTYLRRWITGREELVLLEQVWFAQLAVAALVFALGLPLFEHLDLLAVALCPFLAGGRTGCLLVGCCHGRPSSFGIVYPSACADHGFERALVGVRLFPVQLIEGIGLVAIGAVAFVLLVVAPVGSAFGWFLVAYAVMRFGLEEIRGDRRPYVVGLSQAQWMSIAEVTLVLGFGARPYYDAHPIAAIVIASLLVVTLVVGLVVRRRGDASRALTTADHLREVRAAVRSIGGLGGIGGAGTNDTAAPVVETTSRGVTVAVTSSGPRLHVSLSLPREHHDLGLLCRVAAGALPELESEHARSPTGRVLHLDLSANLAADAIDPQTRGRMLYGEIVRAAQHDHEPRPADLPEVLPGPEPAPVFVPVDRRSAYFGAEEGTVG